MNWGSAQKELKAEVEGLADANEEAERVGTPLGAAVEGEGRERGGEGNDHVVMVAAEGVEVGEDGIARARLEKEGEKITVK